MALVTHQIQGSCATCLTRPVSWNTGIELKQFARARDMAVKTDRFFSLRCKSCLNVASPLTRGLEPKCLRIATFEGGAQNDESGGRANESKPAKNSVKLSYVQEGSEKTLTASSKMQDVPVSYVSEADETVAGSLARQNLFKNWLKLVCTSDPPKISVMQNGTQSNERGGIPQVIWCYFWGLDATIKIPLLLFIPLFLIVNIAYGAEVSKALIPLWACGPLIVALHIKMLQVLCALYVSSFKQTVNTVKSIPTCYALVYNYIARGKLKEEIRSCLWYEWAVEKYMNIVESVRPNYRRAISSLKRAKLI